MSVLTKPLSIRIYRKSTDVTDTKRKNHSKQEKLQYVKIKVSVISVTSVCRCKTLKPCGFIVMDALCNTGRYLGTSAASFSSASMSCSRRLISGKTTFFPLACNWRSRFIFVRISL